MEHRQPYEGPRLRVLVLDRRLAARRTMAVEYAVISIRDSHDSIPDAVLAESPLRRAILRLRFDDIGDIDDADEAPPGYLLFGESHARQIVRFVDAHLHAIQGLIVHCEAGISRSAAVAAVLSRAINGDDAFLDEHFSANPRVRAVLTRQITLMAPEGWGCLPDASRHEREDTGPLA